MIGAPGRRLARRRCQPRAGARRCRLGRERWRDPRLVRLARTCRRNGGAAIDDAAVRQEIGAFVARSRIQRYLGYAVATRAALGTTQPSDAPTTKIWFSELNLELSEYAHDAPGAARRTGRGRPLLDDGWWQDSFLYARAWTIAGGSNEIMRNLIAERGLGLPAGAPAGAAGAPRPTSSRRGLTARDVLQRRDRLPLSRVAERRVVGLQAPVVVGRVLPGVSDE